MTATVLSLPGLITAFAIAMSLLNPTAVSGETATPPRIGVLAAPYASAPANQGLSEGLRALGYVETQSIVIEPATTPKSMHWFGCSRTARWMALLVTGDLLLFSRRANLASAIRKAGLPANFPSREWHGADVLLSYAPSIREAGRRMAVYVDRILKGARAGELPIEQLSKYELVIDLRVAHAMGLDVLEDLLLRADEVIR